MKKTTKGALLGGVSVLVFIIIFTNIFGVDPSTFYIDLIEDTIFKKYHLDIVLAILIILAMFRAYKKSKRNETNK